MKPSSRSLLAIGIAVASLAPATAQAAPVGAGASAAAGQHADPTVGPHARDDARHAHDRLILTPATGAPQPLRPRQAAPQGAGSASAAVYGGSGMNHEVFGFAPYWALTSNGGWNYSTLTTLAYFGLDLKYDGTFDQSDTTSGGWKGWHSDQMTNMVNKAHLAGDRVVVTIKQFDEASLCSIVMSPSVTQTAITNTIDAINAKNLDGVNVDFEGSSVPGCAGGSIQAGFTNFMTQLTRQVHQRWPLSQVSVDTYSGSASWDGGIFNIRDLGTVVDAMFTMNYDMYPNLPGQANANAPINGWSYNDALTVSQYVSKAPASKVILGVPYYGYKWSTKGNWPWAETTSGPEAIPYIDVLSDLACAQQLQTSWDYIAQVPWASWWSPARNDPCGGNRNSWREVYYDNASSLGIKYDLVNSYGLRGAGMWALGFDGNAPELWAVLKQKFSTAWPGQYHAVTPRRIIDTRDSGTRIGPGQTIDVQVTGADVPSSATAVIVNATVTQPTEETYVTLYPAGAGRALSSNLNVRRNQTAANLVEVGLGGFGKVTIFNAAGSAHVILDVAGYVSTPAAADPDGRFTALQPSRVFDSRNPDGGGPLRKGEARAIPVWGRAGVPAGARAVAINLTVTHPVGAPSSYLTAYPTGLAQRPNVSNINFGPWDERANRAIVPIGADGSIVIYNADGQTDVVIDVNGWFAAPGAAVSRGQLTVVSPVRIADTRIGLGAGAIGEQQFVSIQAAGMGPVPTMSAPNPPTAVVLNVTATDPSAQSFITVYPGNTIRPISSDVNFTARRSVPNLVIAKLGSDGTIDVYNAVGATNVIVDVLGWYN